MNIILCGYKSSGKTTIAEAYSQLYSYGFIDTDHLIREKYQLSHGKGYTSDKKIYHEMGALEFRKFEADVIRSIPKVSNTMIATGGGAVVEPSTVEYLKSLGKIIYLQVDRDVLYQRLSTADPLPGFINENNMEMELKKYLVSRDDVYNSVSDHVINTDDKTIDEIISVIHQYRCHHGQ